MNRTTGITTRTASTCTVTVVCGMTSPATVSCLQFAKGVSHIMENHWQLQLVSVVNIALNTCYMYIYVSLIKQIRALYYRRLLIALHYAKVYFRSNLSIMLCESSPTAKIDECSNVTCQNGGTCQAGVNTFTCSCAIGYTGQYCQSTSSPLSMRFDNKKAHDRLIEIKLYDNGE